MIIESQATIGGRRELASNLAATGKSTSATDTDFNDDTALSCVAVPMKSASDLSILHVPLLDIGGTSGENGQAGSCVVDAHR